MKTTEQAQKALKTIKKIIRYNKTFNNRQAKEKRRLQSSQEPL